MTLVIENVYDDLVDPLYNGEFVEYHLEGQSLVAEDLVNGGRYLVDVRLHPLDADDYLEPGVYAFHVGSVVTSMIIDTPQKKQVEKRRWYQFWQKDHANG